MNLSSDYPTSLYTFDLEKARQALLSSPVIKQASLFLAPPNSLRVEYQVRHPIALIHDLDNVGMDDEGHIFPMYPFFSPKNLPEIYMDLDVSTLSKNYAPLKGAKVQLALELIHLINTQDPRNPLHMQIIDVSKIECDQYAKREIVICCREELFFEGTTHPVNRWLRLRTQDYAAQLGNYIQLRPRLLQQDREKIEKGQPLEDQMIDLRIAQLGFLCPLPHRPSRYP